MYRGSCPLKLLQNKYLTEKPWILQKFSKHPFYRRTYYRKPTVRTHIVTLANFSCLHLEGTVEEKIFREIIAKIFRRKLTEVKMVSLRISWTTNNFWIYFSIVLLEKSFNNHFVSKTFWLFIFFRSNYLNHLR